MSFGGFGGFGQNNNNQQSGSGFGGSGTGFGQTGNSTGFGTSNSGGFGQSNTGGGLFGGNNQQQNTTSGFGSSGFGATNNNAFGANKPAFGSTATTGTTGGGLFGGGNTNTTNTGFGSGGGFGATTTTSTFGGGGNTTGGGLFGNSNNQSKPAFGASTTGGGSLFGGGGNTATASTGFGSGSTGFGATAGGNDPPGTGNTPFQAHTEKETTSNTTNSFQNITFQDPYKKWSAEELRLADYAQGRRQGNPSGAGAFGQSSGFGGFGASNNNTTQQTSAFGAAAKPAGGLFGSSNTATTGTGFGQTNTGTGFGASNTNNTGGGLFGNNANANKPAGGLFGNSGTTQTQQSGGVFGSSNTGGGFGGASTGTGFGASTTNTGGGLFGGSNNNQQKPAGSGFSFGNTNNTGTTGGFGSSTTTGGAFGSNTTQNTGGGLFGNNNTQQQQSTGGGLFGNSNNTTQQPSTGGFGGGFGQQNQSQQSSGGGLFGAKPAATGGGLFGNSTTNTTTGGGLFGNNNNQQQQQQGSAFGQSATSGGGLFGAKPAATGTGGGLFGNSTTQQNTGTGGGLFGGMQNNQNQQQNTGGGLFGGMNNQNQPKPGGLFGNSTTSTGGGLFGNSTQSQGGSMFGGNNQQQQNQGMGNSLLGNSQQAGNAPQGLTANLNDVSAYGSPGLFSGVGGNEVANPGPLATSLNGSSKPRRGSILPMYKLNPASASRFNTPQKRGFGFSYSNYGTPGGSPASSISSTPGGGNGSLGRSLLGGSTSSGLSKSMSTNNLRRTYNSEDSILNPGAFSSSSGARWYGSTGSKKLVINRDIRSDLFSTPQKDKAAIDSNPSSRKLAKKVSFDTANVDAEEGTTPVRQALPAPEDPQEETPRQSRPSHNGSSGSRTPEVEQTKNNELGIVHEEDNSATPEGNSSLSFDNAPGRYWMSPSMDDIQNMNRMQRQKIDNFTVGRDNVGSILFKVPVDMSAIDLDEICGGIVQLEPRSATVYPIAAKKPPVGKGLNVPARITLEQSWPRGGRDRRAATDQKRFNKHVERLKRIPDTTFESYDKDTGLWVFSVEHFTTYGLDDSDDDDDFDGMDETAGTPEIKTFQPAIVAREESPMQDDDTFDFKRPRGVPGAFGVQDEMYDDEQPMQQSFLGVSSADSAPRDIHLSLEEDDQDQGEEYDMSDDEEMTRSSVEQHLAAEHDDVSSESEQITKIGTPGGILRARMRALKDSAGPVKLEVADGDDWTEMLRKTVSPVKRDRQQLREYNDSPSRQPKFNNAKDEEVDTRKTSIWQKSVARPNKMEALAASTRMAAADKGRGFATSIDLMNSLFEKPKPMAQSMRASTSSKGFPKWPYERQDKTLTMGDEEQAFHDASRPTWGPSETLVITTGASQRFGQTTRDGVGVLAFQRPHVQTDRQSVRLANFSTQPSKKYLRAQDQFTRVHTVKDVPAASLEVANVKDVFHNEDQNDPASIQEKRVWELASILFDDVDSNSSEVQKRRTALSGFWTDLVRDSSTKSTGLAATSEEKAVACLSGHRVADACKHLLDGKNFRLGTLVALIGTNDAVKKDMREQLRVWRDSKMLSEFSESIRTIYELISGNVGVCEGLKSVPAEDRIESFVISNKFGLDWKQAFGLRLWYGIAKDDDLSAAVRKFKNDVDQERESTPRPWYVDQGIKPLWQDDDEESRQDLLWGLLQLYADEKTDLQAVLRPENSQLSPFDMRLSWQLGLALTSTGRVSFGKNATEKADGITLAYASQLTSAGEWLEAIFVLMHLSDSEARAKAIKEQLCRHAGQIGPESGPNFAALTQKLQIPTAWVWEALALYMRSVKKDASGEVECLLRAGSFDEAHRVLTNEVAPRAIIERDYATLSSLIAQFEGRERSVSGWSSGGEIYHHFLSLLQQRSKGENTQPSVLDRLQAGLHAMNEDVPETDLMRYAAVSDMADETAKEILKLGRKKQDSDLRSKILNLPLTQDRRLAYTMDLSGKRSSEVMSH